MINHFNIVATLQGVQMAGGHVRSVDILVNEEMCPHDGGRSGRERDAMFVRVYL